jgi:hypothetical protein
MDLGGQLFGKRENSAESAISMDQYRYRSPAPFVRPKPACLRDGKHLKAKT